MLKTEDINESLIKGIKDYLEMIGNYTLHLISCLGEFLKGCKKLA